MKHTIKHYFSYEANSKKWGVTVKKVISVFLVGLMLSTCMVQAEAAEKEPEPRNPTLGSVNVDFEITTPDKTELLWPDEMYHMGVKVTSNSDTGDRGVYVKVQVKLDDANITDRIVFNSGVGDWEYRNGWYYNDKALLDGETIDPIQGVKVPEIGFFGYKYPSKEKQTFLIHVKAIQAANMTDENW